VTPDQLRDVLEEISEWPLADRRAYIANLEMVSAEEAKQVKDGLTKLWTERK
jgi:hypothetical protein